MSFIRRWVRRAGVAFLSLGALAVGGEALLRLSPGSGGPQSLIQTQITLSRMIHAADPELGALLVPSQRLRVETLDFTYTLETDHAGFTNAEPWPEQVDVAVLGNSLLIGAGVGRDAQLTSALERRLGGPRVLNLGIPGGGTEHELLAYRRFAAPLRPRLVVATLWVVWDVDNSLQFATWQNEGKPDSDYTSYRYNFNVTHAAQPGAPASTPSAADRALRILRQQLSKSRLVRSAYQRLRFWKDGTMERATARGGAEVLLSVRDQERLARGIEREVAPDMRDIFFRPLEQLRTEVEQSGGRLVVVLVPSKEELYAGEASPQLLRTIEDVRAGLEARQLPVLDLYPVLGAHQEAPFFRADMHLNALGNQVAANAIAEWIGQQQIFSAGGQAAGSGSGG